MKRREFLKKTTVLSAGLVVTGLSQNPLGVAAEKNGQKNMEPNSTFVQPNLPYSLDALVPFLSEEQMRYHYEKHHAGYFKNLRTLTEGKPEATWSLEKIIKTSSGGLFNNAAQAWNHTFFWNCMSLEGGGKPSGKLSLAIDSTFGSFNGFCEKFIDTSTKIFGSGWGWLAVDSSGKLEVMPLPNGNTPIKSGQKPILVVDVWEHAYYIDYRNDRAKFVAAFMDKINWKFVEQQYASG